VGAARQEGIQTGLLRLCIGSHDGLQDLQGKGSVPVLSKQTIYGLNAPMAGSEVLPIQAEEKGR
jgi:hypothetical protein